MHQATAPFDLAIIGGGCAGLMLAHYLLQQAPPQIRILLLESRAHYTRDKTWCFWQADQHGFSDLVQHRWQQWSFGLQGEVRDWQHTQAGALSYQCIPSDVFYEAMQARLSQHSGCTLLLGTRLTHCQTHDTGYSLQTDAATFYANAVVDTRPPDAARWRGGLQQVFLGYEVRTTIPVFSAGSAGLMQGMSSDEYGFRFTYTLPFSPTHALVEETRFTAHTVPLTQLQQRLTQTLQQRLNGQAYQVEREEYGCIPMTTHLANGASKPATYVRAGTGGGAVRAASGYAFQRIQGWALQCAQEFLRTGLLLPHPPEPRWRQAMDAIFLEVLRTRPALTPQLFMRMAQALDDQTFARFLSEKASIADVLQVVRAMPTLPFIQALPVLLPHIPRGLRWTSTH
ncbi:MAG: lycopene cyclase family protein [Candidatus Thiothrix sulfatifontis]|nr:MAG: lycopene cyclase family protein [Candidatus Thiothrix sulfatifontis]